MALNCAKRDLTRLTGSNKLSKVAGEVISLLTSNKRQMQPNTQRPWSIYIAFRRDLLLHVGKCNQLPPHWPMLIGLLHEGLCVLLIQYYDRVSENHTSSPAAWYEELSCWTTDPSSAKGTYLQRGSHTLVPMLHFFKSVSDDRHCWKPAWQSTVNALTLKVSTPWPLNNMCFLRLRPIQCSCH